MGLGTGVHDQKFSDCEQGWVSVGGAGRRGIADVNVTKIKSAMK